MASTDPIAAGLRRQQAVSAFLPLFFVSGATSLVYQTVWARQLHLVFGTSTFAIATVLTAFMGGLAIGGFAMARYADGVRRPLVVYGVLELAIGAYAAVFPAILTLITPAYLAVARDWQPGPVGFGLAQLLLVGAALILPTAAMGATLPLLARFATERLGAAGDRVGTLYSVNTAGAVFGTWVAGFVLLPALGLWTTTAVAAAANAVLGIAAFALASWMGHGGIPPVAKDIEPPGPLLLPVAAAMGLAGFASLVYEVAWTRVLGLLIGPTVYAFSVMLLAFLVGIALGGKLGGPVADRVFARRGVSGVLALLAAVELAVAGLSWLLIFLYPELPYWYVWIFDWLGVLSRPGLMWGLGTLISGLVMTPPAVLMGFAFPVAVRIAVRGDGLGRPVGFIYGANTLGGVFGAGLAGFVLLPWLEVSGTLYLAGLANIAAALALVALTGHRRAIAGFALAAVVLAIAGRTAPWDKRLMTSGLHHYISHFEDHSRKGITRFGIESYDLLYYREGLTSVVTVGLTHDSKSLWLANNGKVDASKEGDGPTQVLCGLLALQFVETPSDVAVIGLASGVTAGAVALSPKVKRLDVVEIEPAIVEASDYFLEVNHDVLRDPRTRVVTNDARNHLLLIAPQTYDLVISEPSNPWITGVANLFTREFFELGFSRVKPGGVWAQWLPTYGLGVSELRILMVTFADVFPHVLVYTTIDNSDLVLLGSDRPMSPTLAASKLVFENPELAAELRNVNVDDPVVLASGFLFDQDAIARMARQGVVRNTDDNMHIEYVAPLKVHARTSLPNVRFINKHARLPWEEGTADPLEWADLARAYAEADDARRTEEAFLAAAALLPEGDPLRAEWIRNARAVAD